MLRKSIPLLFAFMVCAPALRAQTGWLGIALSCEGCDRSGGKRGPLVVTRIAQEGPAARSPLRVGDTIVTVNKTVRDPEQMRALLLALPRDSTIEFLLHGARGRYTVVLRKAPNRVVRVGRDSLPVKYSATFRGVGVEVLTGAAPVIRYDESGALIIQLGNHAVRLSPGAAPGASPTPQTNDR